MKVLGRAVNESEARTSFFLIDPLQLLEEIYSVTLIFSSACRLHNVVYCPKNGWLIGTVGFNDVGFAFLSGVLKFSFLL